MGFKILNQINDHCLADQYYYKNLIKKSKIMLYVYYLVEKIQPKSSKNRHHKCKNTNLFQKWV